MKKNNITKFPFCYGCGVCEITCPHKIISMRLNADGFYAPVIDEPEKCTECGLCLSVCAHNSADLPAREREEIKSFAAWSKDHLTRLKCSSGGVGMEIARAALSQGFKPVLCRFDVRENRAEHYLAENEDALLASAGSKYIPSFTVPGFSKLNRREKFLVSGTPCQIDSLRRWARKMRCEDNFVFLDFFCHGAPSMNLWKKYSAMQKKHVGELEEVSWRNKATGWHDSWAMGFRGGKPGERIVWNESYCMFLREKKTFSYSRLTRGDVFYKFFLGDVCFGRACYETCKYKKGTSSADIRIGDLWGRKYAKDEDGVSVVLSFTERGDAMLRSLAGTVEFHEEDFETATEGQMPRNARKPKHYPLVMRWLRSGMSMETVNRRLDFARRLISIPYFPRRIAGKILRALGLRKGGNAR